MRTYILNFTWQGGKALLLGTLIYKAARRLK